MQCKRSHDLLGFSPQKHLDASACRARRDSRARGRRRRRERVPHLVVVPVPARVHLRLPASGNDAVLDVETLAVIRPREPMSDMDQATRSFGVSMFTHLSSLV